MRQTALGTESADFIETGGGGVLNVIEHVPVVERTLLAMEQFGRAL